MKIPIHSRFLSICKAISRYLGIILNKEDLIMAKQSAKTDKKSLQNKNKKKTSIDRPDPRGKTLAETGSEANSPDLKRGSDSAKNVQ